MVHTGSNGVVGLLRPMGSVKKDGLLGVVACVRH